MRDRGQADIRYTTSFHRRSLKEAPLDHLIAHEIRHLTAGSLPIYDAADPVGACVALCAYGDENRSL